MEPALSSITLGGYGMLRGTVITTMARPMLKTTTIHYPCRWRQVVPIVRANVDDTRWIEKAKRGGVASSVVLACVVGMMSMGMGSGKAMSAVKRAVAVGPDAGRVTVPLPKRGGLDASDAIEALMEVSNFLTAKEKSHRWTWHKKPSKPSIDPVRGPSKEDVDEIKKVAMYKIKTGYVEEGESLLRGEYDKWKVKGGEVEYNMEMALVELLISQGKYEEARNFNCIKEEQTASRPTDPRKPLYKAIIYTVLMNERPTDKEVEDAKKLWDAFKDTVGVDHSGRLPSVPK